MSRLVLKHSSRSTSLRYRSAGKISTRDLWHQIFRGSKRPPDFQNCSTSVRRCAWLLPDPKGGLFLHFNTADPWHWPRRPFLAQDRLHKQFNCMVSLLTRTTAIGPQNRAMHMLTIWHQLWNKYSRSAFLHPGKLLVRVTLLFTSTLCSPAPATHCRTNWEPGENDRTERVNRRKFCAK